MALFIGILGLPNVGKSTLFNALTQGNAEASNYPFCTVEPNLGQVEVPDLRLVRLNEVLSPLSCTPTHIQFVDIAGLVRGASRGEGLGNQFLAHIREADALIHVVRCFEGEQIAHVDGRIDPIEDIAVVETELMLADLDTGNQVLTRLEKILRSAPRGPEKAEFKVVSKIIEGLKENVPIRSLGLNLDEKRLIATSHFLTGKEVLYLANVGEEDLPEGGLWVEKLKAHLGDHRVLAVSAQIESEMVELPGEDREIFLEELGLDEMGLNRLVLEGYGLLHLITFYTVANQKLQAWQLEQGTAAPQAAGKIHSDMEAGIIRAEIVGYEDLMASKGMEKARSSGQLRTEGKEYVIEDGDVVQFLFKT